jgi:anti-anti-sigma factor
MKPAPPGTVRSATALSVRDTGRVSDDETFHVEMDSHADETLTVSLAGDLDMADSEWVEATLTAAAEHHSKLTIDLGGLDFVDSTGLRTLIALKQTATIREIDVRFDNPSAAVARVIQAAGIHSVLD